MNFHDIVTVKGPSPSKAAAAEVAALVKRTENVRGWHAVGAPDESIDRIATELRTARLNFYLKYGHLPRVLRETLWVRYGQNHYDEAKTFVRHHGFGEDVLTQMADAPKTSLSSLRELATQFGFPIMPFEYVRADVRGPAEHMRRVLDIEHGLRFRTYIMGPVEIYSVTAHMEATEDLPVYAAGSALNSALLTVPALRSLKREMREMRDDFRERISRVEQDVKSIQTQVASMAMEIAETRRATAIAHAEATAAMALAKKTWESFCLRDPIAVALPPGTKITDNGWAVIGPCWGPDFEEIVALALGARPVSKQRALLAKRWPAAAR